MIDKSKCLNWYSKKHYGKYPECPVCHKTIYSQDLDNIEYVKTKRGTEIFIHTRCVKKWGKLKLLSLFSGIGAFEKALENIGEPFEVVRYCEIDKYASKAYSLIHNLDENMNLKDIKDVDTHELPDNIDLVTYGFPCQDISTAGKQKGFVHDGELTRSGLFFEALRIIEDAQPKIAICENVKALTSKKFKTEFKIVLDSLNDAGYKNYWAVLNAKDYGILQNRERVFIISIRNDIDHGFEFPEKYELKLRLKDLLEDNVDEKFYLSDEQVRRLTRNVFNSANRRVQEKDYCDTQLARDYKDPKCVAEIKQVGQIYPNGGNPQAGRVYDDSGISPALDTCQGGNRMPKIQVKNATKQGYAETSDGDFVNLQFPDSKTRRGRVIEQCSGTLQCNDNAGVVVCGASRGRNPENPSDRKSGSYTEQRLELRNDECTNTITTVQKDNLVIAKYANVLTPKRTAYGKSVRKAYESGELKESRHNMTEMVPRDDGISNTLTTVLKDNYIVENDCAGSIYSSQSERFQRGVCPIARTLKANNHDTCAVFTNPLRIRKLTPKECFRLMGFDDLDVDILIDNGISNSQLYKMAGNSIVVDVLEEIFVELLNQYEDVFSYSVGDIS